MEKRLRPVQVHERIHSLDVLRGFSLLGIFLVNMMSFQSPILYYDPLQWWKDADQTLFNWIEILVQSSFYPIFAMMFGYGIVILRERAIQKEISFQKIGFRRLGTLFIIGIIHAFFIWSGDILINYAVFGFLLLFMLKWSGKGLISSGLALFLIPTILFCLLILISAIISPSQAILYADITSVTESIKAYATGSYSEIMKQRFNDWYIVNGPSNIIFILFSILPLMMIGAGAAKLRWLEKARENKTRWIWILSITLILGLLLKSLPVLMDSNLAYLYIQQSLGGTILSFAYVAIIVLLMTNRLIANMLRPLAAAGRMSLTIYLTQSIVGTLIFYSYGLGLYSKITLGTSVLLTIIIFIIQIILAEIWFLKFKYGPMEKVWRWFTYGKSRIRKM